MGASCDGKQPDKGTEALRSFRQKNAEETERSHWSFILLDIGAPSGDGFDRLRRIRAISDAPTLVTGRQLVPVDRVVALELGADGCIDMPFDVHEFWAQARAIERRQTLGRYQLSRPAEHGTYRFDGWTLTLLDRRLVDPTGHSSPLSRSTCALLLAFLDAPGTPLSRAFLSRAIHAREDVYDRSIDAQVLRLRRLLYRGAEPGPLIRTARGVGYVFDAFVERRH